MSCNFIIVNGIICRTIFLLQNFIFIPLDIFENITHNKNISNRLEAWLTFFSADSPEKVIELIKQYPDFKAMYEHVYYLLKCGKGDGYVFRGVAYIRPEHSGLYG